MRSSILLPLTLTLAALGCNRDLESICRQRCECQPCTEADVDGCLKTVDEARASAVKQGCTKQIDGYYQCLDETLSCQEGAGPGTTQCADQEKQLLDCAGTGDPFRTVCQQAADKSAMCTGGTPPNLGTECSGVNRCQSACIIPQACNVIIGLEFSADFQSCLNACFSK